MSSSGGPGDPSHGPSKPFSLSSKQNGASSGKTAFNFQSSRSRQDSQNRSLPRPHQFGHDDDSDEEDKAPVHEAVAGFDTHTGGAITADGKAVAEKGPLVITVASKNNWRDRAGTNMKRGKKNLLPKEVQAMREAERNGQSYGDNVEVEGPSMAYGLSFAKKEKGPDGKDQDQPMADARPDVEAPEPTKPLTEDELAIRELIRETNGEVERRTDLVIGPSNRGDGETPRYDETSSFRMDFETRPESATLDQYNAIPVEEFGAALLRGMGWKDGQSAGRGNYGSEKGVKKPVVPRRPGFLGIGAKDSSGGKGAETELGAWGKSAMRKASRKQGGEGSKGPDTEGVYLPVMMRSKTTGEYITEEELADMKKKAAAQPDKDEWPAVILPGVPAMMMTTIVEEMIVGTETGIIDEIATAKKIIGGTAIVIVGIEMTHTAVHDTHRALHDMIGMTETATPTAAGEKIEH
ncbi:hypothetical protein N7468_005303 [Penicillium chermesinum]|uniref:Pre-mRNA-splicing factor n=1 Tax=Penicillium chermesinum TaxID=63820 RepID=A0A9W9P1D2_9EURO|nr:uncharacterized protein N7468_005303 [Penicillium chermesinum]KAJ5232347.1 hypothetical protein N7468_005303 [Penicillium chermesinum]